MCCLCPVGLLKPHSELSGPSSPCVFVCLCVFWRQPLDHSETRTRRGQRLSHYPLFLSLLSPVPLFHVLFMLALSPFPSLSVFPPTSHSHIHPLPTSTRSSLLHPSSYFQKSDTRQKCLAEFMYF